MGLVPPTSVQDRARAKELQALICRSEEGLPVLVKSCQLQHVYTLSTHKFNPPFTASLVRGLCHHHQLRLLAPGSNMMHTRSPYKSNTIFTSSLEILHGFQISIFRVHQRPRLHPLHPSSQPPSLYELLNLKAFPPQPLHYSDLATPTNKSHVQILKFHIRNMRTKSPNPLRV